MIFKNIYQNIANSQTLLAFSCLGSSLLILQFEMIALLGKVALVVSPCFSSPWIFDATPFWPEMFLLRNQMTV